jgi:NIPSNAP
VTSATPRWEQAFSVDGGKTWETNWIMDFTREPGSGVSAVAHLGDYQVVELRRYSLVDGKRERFARTFESYFPEAFEQLGAMVFGQFGERRNPAHFTWLRGYKDMDARATVNAAFYFGPLWKEHRTTLNGMMTDSDNVLLLRPLTPERGIPVLPAVDPVDEAAGARGVAVAQIFAVRAGGVEALARQAEPSFAGYRAAGAREAGVLVTLDVPNNFPQLPIRTDGPFLVWLGVLEDDQALRRFEPLAGEAARALAASGLLRGEPELVVLDPTARSRLRWLPGGEPLRDSR